MSWIPLMKRIYRGYTQGKFQPRLECLNSRETRQLDAVVEHGDITVQPNGILSVGMWCEKITEGKKLMMVGEEQDSRHFSIL